MKIKCYSVRLAELRPISLKAYKAVAFDGSEAIIPASQYFGRDNSVTKSDAVWISAWILEKKELLYSSKKVGWFDSESRRQLPTYTIERHTPERQAVAITNQITELKR